MSVDEMLPFPPGEYMALVTGGAPDPGNHFAGSGVWSVNMLDEHAMLGADVRFLDIGCGCGRIARALALMGKPLASYHGFDRHQGMIDWCCQEITSRFPKFSFSYFDIKSAYQLVDKQDGTISATEFRFPFADSAFDSVLLWSVFSHMPMAEIHNYLAEIHRVLSPQGKVFLSVFLTEGDVDKVESGGFDFHLSKRHFLDALAAANFHYEFITHATQDLYILWPLAVPYSGEKTVS